MGIIKALPSSLKWTCNRLNKNNSIRSPLKTKEGGEREGLSVGHYYVYLHLIMTANVNRILPRNSHTN